MFAVRKAAVIRSGKSGREAQGRGKKTQMRVGGGSRWRSLLSEKNTPALETVIFRQT